MNVLPYLNFCDQRPMKQKAKTPNHPRTMMKKQYGSVISLSYKFKGKDKQGFFY